MRYIVVESGRLQDLINDVNIKLMEGYVPIGGVAIAQQLNDGYKPESENLSTLYDAGFIYAQAMIKRGELE